MSAPLVEQARADLVYRDSYTQVWGERQYDFSPGEGYYGNYSEVDITGMGGAPDGGFWAAVSGTVDIGTNMESEVGTVDDCTSGSTTCGYALVYDIYTPRYDTNQYASKWSLYPSISSYYGYWSRATRQNGNWETLFCDTPYINEQTSCFHLPQRNLNWGYGLQQVVSGGGESSSLVALFDIYTKNNFFADPVYATPDGLYWTQWMCNNRRQNPTYNTGFTAACETNYNWGVRSWY